MAFHELSTLTRPRPVVIRYGTTIKDGVGKSRQINADLHAELPMTSRHTAATASASRGGDSNLTSDVTGLQINERALDPIQDIDAGAT